MLNLFLTASGIQSYETDPSGRFAVALSSSANPLTGSQSAGARGPESHHSLPGSVLSTRCTVSASSFTYMHPSDTMYLRSSHSMPVTFCHQLVYSASLASGPEGTGNASPKE